MEIIAFDSELKEKYPLEIEADFEVGDTSASNNFEVNVADMHDYGIYIPGTEFGGIIEYENDPSYETKNTYRGWTWRGLLTQWIIEPDNGKDYKVVSGEGNSILRNLLSDVLGGFFHVPDIESGLTIKNYQFKLHCTVLEGLMDMLSEYGYKLKIYAKRLNPGESITVFCEAVRAQKVEGTYDEDTGLDLAFTDNRMGINHLICWGSGQLQERQRIDLYLDADGNISETQYYTGFQERQAIYDYSNAESLEELKKGGIDRLKEVASSKNLQVDEVSEVDLEIGDIVVGRKNDVNLIVEAQIIRKILRISRGKESIEYKVKGEG